MLKYLPSDKAQDARNFMMSFQYWLGGSPENIEALLLNLGREYVPAVIETKGKLSEKELENPEIEVLADKGIWHPMAPQVYQTLEEYNAWYDGEHAALAGIDVATAPTVGVVLQKSHINTGDDCHYTSLIAELESRGARVVAIYSGGLDFSGPVMDYFFKQGSTKASVDSVINLTGFALVGGPASQDHGKAVEVLEKLYRAVPVRRAARVPVLRGVAGVRARAPPDPGRAPGLAARDRRRDRADHLRRPRGRDRPLGAAPGPHLAAREAARSSGPTCA